jgi:hypothetical protein
MNESLFKSLIREASPKISTNLSSKDSSAVIVVFESYLRVVFEKIYLRSLPKIDEVALRIGQRVIKEVSEVAPEQRLEYIQRELLDREIGDLDRSAWDIAELSLQDFADLPALQAQAKTILENIVEKQKLLDEKGPEWRMRYARNLSEAALDCNFVLGDHSRSSLRLGRTIRFLQEEGRWPPSQP